MSHQTQQKRPEYTLEFKKDAARLVIEKGYTHDQAAESLGISLSSLGCWVRTERGPTSASTEKKSVLNLTDQTELKVMVLVVSLAPCRRRAWRLGAIKCVT
jgi:transposase